MPQLVDALLESPLKLYLSRLHIEQLASFMDVHSAEPDEMIVKEGSPSRDPSAATRPSARSLPRATFRQ